MKEKLILKSIILSLLTISLTACGGGGGGGGGSSSGGGKPIYPPLVPEEEIIEKPIKLEDGQGFEGKNTTKIILNGNSDENIIAINGTSGNKINNRGSIEISTKLSLGKNIGKIVGIMSVNGEVNNTGIISLNGNSSMSGVDIENGILRNSGKIDISSLNELGTSIGVKANQSRIHNLGSIQIKGKGTLVGIIGENKSEVFNTGNIILNSENKDSSGIKIGIQSAGYNSGKIDISGQGYGMYAEGNSKIFNFGTINIHNQGYGMYAKNGAYAINEGIINLSSQAQGGMVADGVGAIAENKGTINIEKGSSLAKEDVVKAINGGRIINSGEIIFKDKATLYSVGGKYVIGTSQDGSYGKITAENIEIDGNVAIDSGIAKGSYKDSYTLEGVFEGNVEFGEDYRVLSDSLLYDAKIYQREDGNYDGRLERNDKVISDFTTGDYVQTAKLFDRYFSENEYNNLNENGKNLIDSINIEDENILRENIKDLTPTLYANNSRIISEIGDIFKEQREKTISSLGENDYNFSFIGSYGDVDSENIIEGYKAQMIGFVGSMRVSEGEYLSLGYGYTDLDYSGESEGDIYSIHLGMDNYKGYGVLNLQYGIGGEYNCHKIDREMNSFKDRGEADFNSYGVKAYGKISKVYGEVVEFEPHISLDLAYYHIEDIEEKSFTTIEIADENYLSIKPELAFNFAKRFKNLKTYGEVSYSYELGDMDKRVDYSYEGIKSRASLDDEIESGLATFKIGMSYKKNSFTFGVEGGKDFGRRDNSFISGNIGYRF